MLALAAVANLIGWVAGRLTLLDDWAYCDQFPDGCEAHMLAFPVLMALWLSVLIGAVAVFGLAICLSKVRLVPAWFPNRLVFPLAIYFAVQGAVSVSWGDVRPGPPGTRIPNRTSYRGLVCSGSAEPAVQGPAPGPDQRIVIAIAHI